MTTVALDVMGGDAGPAAVVDGALLALAARHDLALVLVGPPGVPEQLLAGRGAERIRCVPATEVVGMDEEPAAAVRAKRDASVRVAARLVRDGAADAMVSVGSTGAALAAAVFTLGRLSGVGRPALAAVIPARRGPLVLLDAGATPDPDARLLAQQALAGAAFAAVRLGLPDPRVGLLSIGSEPGKGDALRKETHALLATLPLHFVGNVEGRDIPMGGVADVVVTDGFTGNVLVKGLEGVATMLTEVLMEAMTATPERREAARVLLPAFAEAAEPLSPDALGGAVLLGVDGVVVVGHGASNARAVASCVGVAADAAAGGLVPRTAELIGRLRERAAPAGTGQDERVAGRP